MYCFRCGQLLPPRGVNCPACDTPQKRRQRRRHRLLLGLFIFLAGGLTGSIVDSVFFKGQAWDHSLLRLLGFSAPASSTTTLYSEPGELVTVTGPAPAPVLPARLPEGMKARDLLTKTGKPVSTPVIPTPVATGAEVSPTDPLNSSVPPGMPELATGSAFPATSAVIPAMVEAPAVATESGSGTDFPGAKGSDPRPLGFNRAEPLADGKGNQFHGSISADGRVLVYSHRPDGDNSRFQPWMRELKDNTPGTPLFPWNGNVWTPEFSRDSSFMVFSSDSQSKEHVFRFDRATQKSRQLTEGAGKNMMPTISPDGRFIVFVSDKSGNNDLWLMGADGTGLVQLTSSAEDDREPRWSHDGKSILFTRVVKKLEDSRIMKIQIEPLGTPEEVIAGSHRNWMPDLSPDGRYLAFVRSSGTDGSGNAILVRKLDDGTEFTVQPFKGAEHYRPVWAPDGEGLVFHADQNGKKSLFLARLKRVSGKGSDTTEETKKDSAGSKSGSKSKGSKAKGETP